MCLQEARILAHDIHDIGGDDRLVVFAPFELTKAEKVLDDSDQKPFFSLLIYAT